MTLELMLYFLHGRSTHFLLQVSLGQKLQLYLCKLDSLHKAWCSVGVRESGTNWPTSMHIRHKVTKRGHLTLHAKMKTGTTKSFWNVWNKILFRKNVAGISNWFFFLPLICSLLRKCGRLTIRWVWWGGWACILEQKPKSSALCFSYI